MAGVMVEKLEALHDPRIEPGLNVLRNFAHDVVTVLEPLEFVARGRGPNGLLTFLTMISVPQLGRRIV